MNKDIQDQKKYNDSMFSTDLNSIFAAPDDTYREGKQQAAEQGDTQAQAWVEQDQKVDTLERRIGQYDSEIERRKDPTHVLRLEEDYQRILQARTEFLENNPKPMMFGKDQWQEQFNVYEDKITESRKAMAEWEEKSSPEVLSELTARRNAKFEEMLDATGQRQKLGELPSEQLMHAQAQSDAYDLQQDSHSFSFSQRIAQRRAKQDEQGEGSQSQSGQRVGGMAWAAETLAKPSDEEKMLADVQHRFVIENNRWPKEKEVDALLAKQNQKPEGQGHVQEQVQVQEQTQRFTQ